jgi:hypothetical protein
MTEPEIKAALEYILGWLHCNEYAAESWDDETQDGHWLCSVLPKTLNTPCLLCVAPAVATAKHVLSEHCNWINLHYEALESVIKKAGE